MRGRSDRPRYRGAAGPQEVAPSYDAAPDVAWTYGYVVDAAEPPDELLSTMQAALARYAEERSVELGRPVSLVGSMAWDTPRLRVLPRWVRRQVLSAAPARHRALRGLRPNVTLVRAWQHTDYREAVPSQHA